MRILLLGLLALAGCTADQRLATIGVACRLDRTYVPLIDTIANLVPITAPFASVDQVLLHPAVLAMCDGLLAGSKPIAELVQK